jgi:hypothetical protein
MPKVVIVCMHITSHLLSKVVHVVCSKHFRWWSFLGTGEWRAMSVTGHGRDVKQRASRSISSQIPKTLELVSASHCWFHHGCGRLFVLVAVSNACDCDDFPKLTSFKPHPISRKRMDRHRRRQCGSRRPLIRLG